MKNLFLFISLALAATVAHADNMPQPQPEPPVGSVLFGDWTTSLRQIGPRHEIRLEISFEEDTMELRAICEFDQVVYLEAATRVPVTYRARHIRVEQRGYAQSRQGPFYCESAINPQIMAYALERDSGDIVRLLFADRREPIFLFKKMAQPLR